MALGLQNKLISLKNNGKKVIKYILQNDAQFFNNAYFVPLDFFTCKGNEIVKIDKVQASMGMVANGVALVAFIFQGDLAGAPPRAYGYPPNILFPYSWPLVFTSDNEQGPLNVGNPNTEKIKAYCESGQTLVLGLYTDLGAGNFYASGIEIEVSKVRIDEY